MKGCPVCPLCQLLIMLIVDILFYPHFRISSCSLRYFSSLDAFSSPPSLCSGCFSFSDSSFIRVFCEESIVFFHFTSLHPCHIVFFLPSIIFLPLFTPYLFLVSSLNLSKPGPNNVWC